MTTTYAVPELAPETRAPESTVYLVASGDLRESANVAGWPTQVELERLLTDAFAANGWKVVRANDVDPETGHGFISSQRMGLDVFATIPPDAPLVVAEAVWQYSHHVLAGLRTHRGPILTAANFAGDWPGLVGLLGLNAGLTKTGTPYSTVWTVDGTDAWFQDAIRSWVTTGTIEHDDSHVHPLPELTDSPEKHLGEALAAQLLREKAIIGVFDEGCMGMYNAIFDDELLNGLGIYKERLSQSALWAEMQRVTDDEADEVQRWLEDAGMTFRLGTDEATELTPAQLRWQHKMYVAALRIADDFGLDAVGIQYQQGLKDICPASDLAEGLLNNVQRPPVRSRDGQRVLWDGQAFPHFNEADEGVAVDALVTNRLWTAMGLDPATTLHDVRWGEEFDGQFVWVFEISGSVPASHLEGGYAGAEGWRQDPVFFPAGGSTINGVSRAGEIVWSRVYIADGVLQVDLGRASAVSLPEEETRRRKEATNPEWPIMHAVLHGVSRDQFMARHKANHLNVAYAPDGATADRALEAKAAFFAALGVPVHLCGETALTR
ncbi:fucose isomerase [Cellulosimicrobium cellulans]|uniref:fucose isomerase n=1 Tax=Cellulosimicrobium cellulans TaxID=1710 RepID=UPI0024076584|nr:fucose isomerase [Cellulosimicrobium cellulans]MDF9877919.1 hypothetical protein [Cellulosimicrobium cellulans]